MEKGEFLSINNVPLGSPLRELEEKKDQQMWFKPSTYIGSKAGALPLGYNNCLKKEQLSILF